MNPVFWLCIILLVIGVWFLLSPMFKSTGSSAINMIDQAKNEMKIESEDFPK